MPATAFLLQTSVVVGYAVSAGLYFAAWVSPAAGAAPGLVKWVAFDKLCLAEFLSLHAATLLAAVSMARASGSESGNFSAIFWALLALYGAMAAGAYLFHRSGQVLLGFYVMLAVRGVQFWSLGGADVDELRSVVLKNLTMTVPMFLLVGGIAMSDRMLTPWQEDFSRATTLLDRVVSGRALLFATGYYLAWAAIEMKWPQRISA